MKSSSVACVLVCVVAASAFAAEKKPTPKPSTADKTKSAATKTASTKSSAGTSEKKTAASAPVKAAGKPSTAPAKTESAAGTPAATPAVLNLGAVRPGNLVLPQLAVQFAGGEIGNIIQYDLNLADVASAPADAQGASTAAEKDRALGSGVDYDAWTVAGVGYVLRGVINGDSAQAELFDIASRRRVFGQSYSGAQNGSRIAHRIADDVMQAISNSPGIFSSSIAYLADESGGNKDVVVMDADGQQQRRLTSENALVAAPAWGRRGQELFFTSYRENNPDLYGITLDGRRFQVSRRPGLNTAASWCEATQRLAVALSKDGNSEIYTMTADGHNLARLTRTGADVADTSPEWSPDGSQLAYTSDDSGQPGIYIMNADGSGAHRISAAGYFDSPSWSPDGKKLAYVARQGGEFNIYMHDLSTNSPVQLTHSQGDNTDPSWGPDSHHLVFASTRGSGRNIYMMNVDTRVAKPITKSGNCSSPVWGPLQK